MLEIFANDLAGYSQTSLKIDWWHIEMTILSVTGLKSLKLSKAVYSTLSQVLNYLHIEKSKIFKNSSWHRLKTSLR